MSSLLKLGSKKGKPQDGKQWLHNPEALTQAAVVYPVKFLGVTEVAQAKGTEVIKDAITKVQFANHLKVSEAGKKGSKLKKVDLKISVDSIKVDDAKTKEELFSYPLHHISYCADDKRSRKMFAFIAKDKSSPQHTCHVFECEKIAEELTLTVGQAFDLAYRRYLENVGRQKLQAAEAEKAGMKQKLSQLEESQKNISAPAPSSDTTSSLQNVMPEPTNNKQDDFNLFGEMPSVPGIPPPPKHTRPAQGFTDLFDPLDETPTTPNGESIGTQPLSGGNGNGQFNQQPFSPHAIASPFDESPTSMNNGANPFDQMFDQPKPTTTATSSFGDSFDPLDQVSSMQPSSTSAFGENFLDSAPMPTTINNPAPPQPMQRPRPAPRTVGAVSLPPPPSKQSVKAAKLAAASGGAPTSPPVPVVPSNKATSSLPSTDLLSMEASSPPNPFARGPGFDPFADSFDPLDSTVAVANNNVDSQFQDLQHGFSKGMKLDSNDLFS